MLNCLRSVTLDELKRSRPDLVKRLEVEQERARILPMLKYFHRHLAGDGFEFILEQAIKDGSSMNGFLEKVKTFIRDGRGNSSGVDDRDRANNLYRAGVYRKVHGGNLTDALRATFPVRI